MKKLILLSDQTAGKTKVEETAFKLFGLDKPKITYIPSQSDPTRKYFSQKVEWYKKLGVTDLLYFDIDKEYDKSKTDELLKTDAIFLSGGNTYYFLNSLKKRNLIPVLRGYVEKGGVLIGVSAGSMIMSKTIRVTTIDTDMGGDQNTVNLKDFSSLGLVDFEFFPHFDENNGELVKRLQEYSKRSNSVIYVCRDGDGIIVNGESVQFIGEVIKIQKDNISKTSSVGEEPKSCKRDWRLQGQEKYLKGVVLRKRKYKQSSPSWDHDHCEFCFGKFMEKKGKDILNEGYVTQDGKRWICRDCFEDFKESFEWKVN